MKLMEKKCSKLTLALRVINEIFTNNRKMPETRLKNLKKRFIRGKQCQKNYARLMEDVIKKV